jgi:hypothetical protein
MNSREAYGVIPVFMSTSGHAIIRDIPPEESPYGRVRGMIEIISGWFR